MVLVSGGGRAEVRVWSMALGEGLNCSGVGSALLRGTDSQRKKPWRLAQEEVVVERETRFLAVDIRWELEGDTFLLLQYPWSPCNITHCCTPPNSTPAPAPEITGMALP